MSTTLWASCAVSQQGRIDVLPLGAAEAVAAVDARQGDAVVPPRGEHHRVPGGTEDGDGADRLGTRDATAVHEDGPGRCRVVGADDPRGSRAVRGGDVDVLDGHVELARGQVEPATPATATGGGEVAGVDRDDAARDGGVGRAEDLADAHVAGAAAEPERVAALQLGVGGALDRDGLPDEVDGVDQDAFVALAVGGDDGAGDGCDEATDDGRPHRSSCQTGAEVR
ncbi:hypothetical protein NYQ25_12740 [Curtobacterium flaccumfaciens pv. flaccumfaciens]|uniref:hypothetical protein n=1 Tax=Curtobacterium flaccumfaciens TaxID=2035 RepID=UPI00217E9125|nr:hypothetical protein [Curtobacterium flaccumfaciens]MCS6585842.1 hypothetical protein [Curtobacterium flaccumfaciens pv. flaccumfaciens]